MRIALATCRDLRDLVEEERPLVGTLAEAGVAAEPVCWDDDADWGAYDAVVVRSVWDYWLRLPEFTAWLAGLEQRGVACWNPVPLIRWNLDKRYLRDLAARGVATVPTLWFDGASHAPSDVAAAVARSGWDDVVLKPTVSAGAWRTLRTPARDLAAHEDAVRTVLADGGLMVQPFVPEVVKDGGSHVAEVPTAALAEQARAALAAAPSPWLYARVDGVVRGGRLVLMELEMIEPYLFLSEGPGSRERFARAVREHTAR